MEAKDIERFNSKYVRGLDDECWLWTGSKTKGYGVINIKKKTIRVNRLALFISTGVWGECACHRCDTPACVNPNHLWWGTQADNITDMIKKGRKAELPNNVGVHNGNAKLTSQQIIEIKQKYRYGNGGLLSLEYGVTRQHIRRIANKN